MNRFLRAVLVSPPCFPDVDFDALMGNPVDHETVLLSRNVWPLYATERDKAYTSRPTDIILP